MKYDSISSASDGVHNEDLVAVFEHDGVLDIVVLDGATSVADANYIDADAGDVVWFVTTFRSQLALALGPQRSQEDSLMLALSGVHAAFVCRTQDVAVPQYALPLAAMSWLRVTQAGDGLALRAYCLGDCKSLVCAADGSVSDIDPYINPQEAVLQAQIALLSAQGVSDPAQRKRQLLPMLRERRVAQNTAAAPSILCLRPDALPAARIHTLALDRFASLLVMTDGFYRLVDTYALHTPETLAQRCMGAGLAAAMAQLRGFESENLGSASLSVKRADDASAVLCSWEPAAV